MTRIWQLELETTKNHWWQAYDKQMTKKGGPVNGPGRVSRCGKSESPRGVMPVMLRRSRPGPGHESPWRWRRVLASVLVTVTVRGFRPSESESESLWLMPLTSSLWQVTRQYPASSWWSVMSQVLEPPGCQWAALAALPAALRLAAGPGRAFKLAWATVSESLPEPGTTWPAITGSRRAGRQAGRSRRRC